MTFNVINHKLQRKHKPLRARLWKVVTTVAHAIHDYATSHQASGSALFEVPSTQSSTSSSSLRNISHNAENGRNPSSSSLPSLGTSPARVQLAASSDLNSKPLPVPPINHLPASSSYPSPALHLPQAQTLEAASNAPQVGSQRNPNSNMMATNGPSHNNNTGIPLSAGHSQAPLNYKGSKQHTVRTRKSTQPQGSIPRSKLYICGSRYTVIGHIASGSFGRVVYAQDMWRRPFAIKIINKAAQYANKSGRKLLLSEKEIMSRATLEKKFFLTSLIASDSDAENVYFVMRLYMGTLDTLLYSDQSLDPRDIKYLFAEIIVGYGQIESLNICHQDIKPMNILISPKGNACFGDVGMAGMAPENEKIQDCEAIGFAGTPGYAAPEVYTRSYRSMCKADIWSLGVVFLEMWVCPERPIFAGKDEDESYKKTMEMPLNFAKLSHSLAKDLLAQDLLRKMLNRRHPEARPTIEEIKHHPYFFGIKWEDVENRLLPMPAMPCIRFTLDPRINLRRNDPSTSKARSASAQAYISAQLEQDRLEPDAFKFVCPPELQHDPLHGDPIPSV